MVLVHTARMSRLNHSSFVVLLILCARTTAWSGQEVGRKARFLTEKATRQDSATFCHDSDANEIHNRCFDNGRRDLLSAISGFAVGSMSFPYAPALASEALSGTDVEDVPIEVTPSSPDARKLFNEGRALESQGNMAAAQRLYARVTQISPRFIYGWANLANTQVAMGELVTADDNYSKAIQLCKTSNEDGQSFGVKKCTDLYVLYLNRGSVRLNNNQPKESLEDLQTASILRGRPDAVIAQNLARAKELNGLYGQADKDYSMAISMTANEVNPFWLRSAMVKLQLGDGKGGNDLLLRVQNRFPDAPEVKAASATFLLLQNHDEIAARRKFLEIPNKQRERFSDNKYLAQVLAWPPVMRDGVTAIAKAVGDS